MKKNLFVILTAAAVLFAAVTTGCESTRTVSHGISDVGYITFTGEDFDAVRVVIDDKIEFYAAVNSPDTRKIDNENNYAVKPGTHSVQVYSGDRLVFSKEVFISSQDIREIALP